MAPAHLDGTLPGDFGFDPLGLGADPQRLKYYQEAELMNARWAMMAVAGITFTDVMGIGVSFFFQADISCSLVCTLYVRDALFFFGALKSRFFSLPRSLRALPFPL